jgi:hypothetical protein
MSTATIRCASCGAALIVKHAAGLLTCEYCGSYVSLQPNLDRPVTPSLGPAKQQEVARSDREWEEVKAQWEQLKALGRVLVGAIITLLGARGTTHDSKRTLKYREAFLKYREAFQRNRRRRAEVSLPHQEERSIGRAEKSA